MGGVGRVGVDMSMSQRRRRSLVAQSNNNNNNNNNNNSRSSSSSCAGSWFSAAMTVIMAAAIITAAGRWGSIKIKSKQINQNQNSFSFPNVDNVKRSRSSFCTFWLYVDLFEILQYTYSFNGLSSMKGSSVRLWIKSIQWKPSTTKSH